MQRRAGYTALLAVIAAVVCGSMIGTAGAPAAPAKPSVTRAASLDDRVRATLASAAIIKVEKGSGGRSLAFRLTFSGDVQGYFKPEQTFAANWSSELAAYYLDRQLGLDRVPPAIGRSITWSRLAASAAGDPRLEEVVVREGSVRGSVVWWIPQELIPLDLPEDWPGWLRIDPRIAVSPFQRPPEYFREKKLRGGELRVLKPPAPTFADRPAELSDLILFDYLIGNIDRWGGENTNVRHISGSERLVYIDNANGFEVREKSSKILEARLSAVQRFRKKSVAAIRALDVKRLAQRMASDPLAPLLSDAQLAGLEERRKRVLQHVAEVEKQYGAKALPW
ncbi:MAG TPA: hypothetical protein VM686_19180 [Polyangiaceae bacterium]|nr:hypothetical protein [Polyangiaceae bacterium]